MIDFDRDCVDLTNVSPSDYKKYIGNGYRYCCYRTDRKNGNAGQIVLFGFDTNGNPTNFLIPHRSHIKYKVEYNTKEKDIFGRNVNTRYFTNISERRKFIEENGSSITIIESLPPTSEFLHTMFDDVALDENFNKQSLRIHYLDIETEISESFEYPKTARNRINMITIYDTLTKKYYTWSLEHCEKNFDDEYDANGNLINESPIKNIPRDDFVIFEFSESKSVLSEKTLELAKEDGIQDDPEKVKEIETAKFLYKNAADDDEKRMLGHFIDWFEENSPDVLCGFNSQAYDIPYIVNRIERVLGNPDNVDHYGEPKEDGGFRNSLSQITKRLSPVGHVKIKRNNLDNERSNKQAEIVADIDGIFLADELVLYRDKYKIKQPLDGGNGLDNIGLVEVGAHKIHYDGTLKELYENNWNKFYFYNVIDVDLLRRVEEKVKLIPLSRMIASAGLSNYDAIYSSIGYLVGSLSMFSKTQMHSSFTSYIGKNQESIPYEGAFVFPPTIGLYKGGIATVDFNSLYPSSIRAMNLSPETYVGKISRFPIEDPTSSFFSKEAPIDLYGTDTTKGSYETDDEVEYRNAYKDKLSRISVEDKDIKTFYLMPANGGSQKIITREQLDELISTKCIFTRNNTLFLKHSVKQGVVSGWCKHFYALRKKTKKNMQKLEMDLYKKLVPEDKIPEVKETIDNLDARQQAIKIMINSIYGICGTSFSPIYNPYMAQSITRTGKFCNLSAAKYIKKVFIERYGVGEDYVAQSSGDTDSAVSPAIVRIIR